jgi:regulator of PEP synthase PpsR (kinase-PPPase family)
MAETNSSPPTILILSGGVGASAEQVVHTVLAQFPDHPVRVVTLASLRFSSQIDDALVRAKEEGAILVHTLVDAGLHAYLLEQAAEQGLTAIDLMGPLLEQLSAALGQPPLEQPGLYRQLKQDYFDRVAAIEYTMMQDDGQQPEGWRQAEIVLLGVSRVGKTPLSMYLSVLGWKVANIPLVLEIPPASELYELDPRRVVGLEIDVTQLMAFRKQRQRRLGVMGESDYTDPEKIFEELQYAEEIFRKGGFRTIQVTDKPIETTADDIIRLITSRLGSETRMG